MLIETYDYQDADGRVLFRVERHQPKRFRIVDPAGNVFATPPLNVLYGLPELLRSFRGGTVYIVEGEKDVETLRASGLTATTNPGGCHAGWKSAYGKWLRRRNVAILPDCDQPGRIQAEKIRTALVGVAASVAVVTLPGLRAPQDVSDWMAAGGTVDELTQLVAVARFAQTGKGKPPKGVEAKRALIFASALPANEKLLLLAIHSRQRYGRPLPITAGELARETSLHRVTVQRLIGAMREIGLLRPALQTRCWEIAWDVVAAVRARGDDDDFTHDEETDP